MLFQNSAICGDCHNLPRNKFSACHQCTFDSIFNTAAAGHFHTHNLYTFDIVVCYYLCQFLCIVTFIKFWATDKCNVVADKFVVEIAVCKGSAVSCNKQIGSVKVWSIYRHKLNLYRPLAKLAVNR